MENGTHRERLKEGDRKQTVEKKEAGRRQEGDRKETRRVHARYI